MTATMNEIAFLSMLAHAEGTDRGKDPYRVCYGYRHTIIDLSTHPAISGEWIGSDGKIGEPLDSLGPLYKGLRSTAAGRYQITRATFLELSAALGTRNFFGVVQSAMALELVKRAGARNLVDCGMLEAAINRCSHIWASLPGSTSGQPQKNLVALSDYYRTAGGLLA